MKMRKMSRFWMMLVVSASLGMTLMWVSPTRATPLTTVSHSVFTSWLGPVVGPPIDYNFDFEHTPPGPDGKVTSAVFEGASGSVVEGLYVYVYQIIHYSGSSENNINGMSLDLLGPWAEPRPPLDLGSIAFQVEDLYGVSLFDAMIYSANPPSSPYPSISFTIPTLPPGNQTWVFGFFSPNPPTITVADIRDTGNTVLSPLVYTPSPEPPAIILLGMGLLGGVFWRRRFNR